MKPKDIEEISAPFHEKIMQMSCCGNPLSYSKVITIKTHSTIETYWCQTCGLSLTRTIAYLDDNEIL